MSRSPRPDWLRSSFCCTSRSLFSASDAWAPPSRDPFAAARRMASAASCTRRIAKLLALLVARQLLQLTRSLFELVGDRPLVGARVPRRTLARLREAAL